MKKLLLLFFTISLSCLAQFPSITLTPKDPMRVIDGKVWRLGGSEIIQESSYMPTMIVQNWTGGGNGWVSFSGTVLQVLPDGVLIRGCYTGYGDDLADSEFNQREFFVAHFPYEVAENESIHLDKQDRIFYAAKTAGTYSYTTVMGASRTIRKLDYGTIYIPPPPKPLTPEQVAAAKAKAAAAKKAALEKALKYNQDLADKGDAYGLRRMGERYRDGDGVETNLDKARDYLAKAIAAGSVDASNELVNLPKK